MSPGRIPSVALRVIDAAVARRVQSRPHFDHSTGRQPRERIAAQPGAAEDPVGRPVVGDRLAARLLDRRPSPLGVVEQRPAASAAAGCGGDGSGARPGGRRRRSRPPARDVSRPARRPGRRSPSASGLAEDLQHRRGALRVRAVVEGEGDAGVALVAQDDRRAAGRPRGRSAPAPGRRAGPPPRGRAPAPAARRRATVRAASTSAARRRSRSGLGFGFDGFVRDGARGFGRAELLRRLGRRRLVVVGADVDPAGDRPQRLQRALAVRPPRSPAPPR